MDVILREDVDKLGTREKLIVHRNLEIEMLDGSRGPAWLATVPLPGPLLLPGLGPHRHPARA